MVRHYSPDGRDVIEILENKELAEVEQGFLTNKSRFVDRKEALKIAKIIIKLNLILVMNQINYIQKCFINYRSNKDETI